MSDGPRRRSAEDSEDSRFRLWCRPSMRSLRARGYANAFGYDVGDGRNLLGVDRENISIGTLLNLRLPYEDNTFDLVTSDQVFEHVQDQVRVFQELHRITKPGGHGLHVIPARYMPIEGHIKVPFGGVIQHRWWYKLWASLGIRNEFQAGLSADETADHNAYFITDATRYVTTSCYRVMWKAIGFEYRFAEQEFFDTHPRQSMRMIGRLGWPAMASIELSDPESCTCASQTRTRSRSSRCFPRHN